MHKPSGARVEVFCLEPHAPADYERAFAAQGECRWPVHRRQPQEVEGGTARHRLRLQRRSVPGAGVARRHGGDLAGGALHMGRGTEFRPAARTLGPHPDTALPRPRQRRDRQHPLSDRLLPFRRLRSRPYGRFALHPGTDRETAQGRSTHRRGDAACGCGHLSSRQDGPIPCSTPCTPNTSR